MVVLRGVLINIVQLYITGFVFSLKSDSRIANMLNQDLIMLSVEAISYQNFFHDSKLLGLLTFQLSTFSRDKLFIYYSHDQLDKVTV